MARLASKRVFSTNKGAKGLTITCEIFTKERPCVAQVRTHTTEKVEPKTLVNRDLIRTGLKLSYGNVREIDYK